MTNPEQRIIDAARAWAKAERDLRNLNEEGYSNNWVCTPWEKRHRASLTLDWTEQKLLDACEAEDEP